jgi:hypothetical protein
MPFTKATKFDSFLRLALAGPAGSGKTFTALTLAQRIAEQEGQPIALIDTEHGSASKYADLFAFDTQELDTFHPQRFIDAIHEAEQGGYGILILDSLSHAWNGIGGLLDLVDQIAKRKYGGNSFSAWKDATPIHNALIDAIIGAHLHIIATMRSKMDYVVEKDEKSGKSMPRQVGLAAIQRDGMEYEFDIVGQLDIDHTLVITKSRCPMLSDQVIARPNGRVADVLMAWLRGSGPRPEPVPVPLDPAKVQALAWIREQLAGDPARIQRVLDHYRVSHLKDLSEEQIADLTARLERQAKASGKGKAGAQ